MLFLIFNQINTGEQIRKSINKQNELIELSEVLKDRIDSTKLDSLYKVKIESILESYKENIDSHNADSLEHFFADSVERYFLVKNVNKDFIINHQKWFWKKYPNSKIIYNTESFSIDLKNKDTIRVFISGIHYRSENKTIEFISHMKFNRDFKIIYIRDFFGD